MDDIRRPTQLDRPWRTTVRTTLQAALGLCFILPEIARAAGVETIPIVASILTITAAITRVLALPSVNMWLDRWLPSISADSDSRRVQRRAARNPYTEIPTWVNEEQEYQ